MSQFIVKELQFGCRKCSRRIPDDVDVVVCGCCMGTYCGECVMALERYLAQRGEKVRCAMVNGGGKRCLGDYFAAVEKLLLAEVLDAMPVPDREKGH